MEEAGWPLTKINFILALAGWVLNNSFVIFDNQTYKQTKGTAMGTPFAVTYAQIFVHQHEKVALAKFFVRFQHHPKLLKRLIDDFLAIVRSIEEANFLKECLNHSGIIITGGHSPISVDFLDITIYKGPHMLSHGILDTTLYQKPMNTYAFITFTSYHQPHVFTNFIVSELRRFTITCSIPSNFTSSCSLFRARLLKRHYPAPFIDNIYATTSFDRKTLLTQAAIKVANLFNNPAHMIDPNDIAPIRIHVPLSSRHIPLNTIDILHTLPDYMNNCPVSRLIFNDFQPFQFTALQAASNLHLLVRSDTEKFFNKHVSHSQPPPQL
jgi:hypothetical protein